MATPNWWDSSWDSVQTGYDGETQSGIYGPGTDLFTPFHATPDNGEEAGAPENTAVIDKYKALPKTSISNIQTTNPNSNMHTAQLADGRTVYITPLANAGNPRGWRPSNRGQPGSTTFESISSQRDIDLIRGDALSDDGEYIISTTAPTRTAPPANSDYGFTDSFMEFLPMAAQFVGAISGLQGLGALPAGGSGALAGSDPFLGEASVLGGGGSTPPIATSGLSAADQIANGQQFAENVVGTPTDVPSVEAAPDYGYDVPNDPYFAPEPASSISPPATFDPNSINADIYNAPPPSGPATASAVSGLNNSIYQPVLQSLTDAGVPFGLVQALPNVINGSLKGGVLSKLMGGSFLTGAELGAIGASMSSFLQANGFPAPSSLISMLTNMIGKQFDLFGGGGGGGGGTSQSPLSSVSGRAGDPSIPWLNSGAEFLGGSPLNSKEVKEVKLDPLTAKNGGLIMKKYAAGGLGAIACLNDNPAYMPKFICTGADVLPNVAPPKRQALTLSKLKQLRQQISPYGDMNGMAQGGLPKKYVEAAPKGHDPEFITGLTGYYACGGGTGQSDDIPAMLHDGDYVMDADVVSALGDGSSKAGMGILEGFRKQVPHKEESGGKAVAAKIADGEYVFPAGFVNALGGGDNKKGAKILDGLREKLRMHKRSAPTGKIPPKAKSPLDYIAKG